MSVNGFYYYFEDTKEDYFFVTEQTKRTQKLSKKIIERCPELGAKGEDLLCKQIKRGKIEIRRQGNGGEYYDIIGDNYKGHDYPVTYERTKVINLDIPKEFEYLEKVRQSGVTNMYGASKYVFAEFPITLEESRKILSEWMNTYDSHKEYYKLIRVREKEIDKLYNIR